ncbi:WbqC family protein [Pseudotenacibaculum sp. MALMAid0570]|mgnify:CR=1 FL=1|uniref:WbqC family protein n=1 Tax=Pseudotenacibaculum sp. MALMAid0570 TaxID=3143938 RepID=UPI0032DECA2F
MALFIPTYFSPISQYGMIFQSDHLEFEVEDNFQKQTYRNRCYIYGANGKQLLNIPITHSKSELKQKTKDILIEEGSNWQKQHYKSLKTAYNSSPFFEFYEDDLMKIFSANYKYLLDVNIDSFLFINDALELLKQHSLTEEYVDNASKDFRNLASVKKHPKTNCASYIQVFDDKFGFLQNLSILDLLFMEGPNTISFLEKVNVTLE